MSPCSSTMPRPVLLDSVAPPDPPGDPTLARLTEHVRALLPVGAVALVTGERFAGWFADRKLGEALGGDALAAARSDLVRAALGRERPFFLSRLDMWETSPVVLAGLVDALGPEHARSVWRACRRASVIACPLRAESGRGLGLLVVASIDPRERLRAADVRTAEVVADLAAMALERADLLAIQTRRARDEVLLKRAGEAMSSSLELADVYRSVVEHAAAATAATQAVLTRLDARAGELRDGGGAAPAGGRRAERAGADAGRADALAPAGARGRPDARPDRAGAAAVRGAERRRARRDSTRPGWSC